MLRRLVAEENGMALGIAVIMMMVIGVLAAGLLAFAQRDLGAVVENNQGQRAFEIAEAGVQAAKQQLATNGGANPESYNGGSTPDYRWSKFHSPPGMTLTNLDGDASTADSVNVQIEYRGRVSGQDVFVAIAEGRYGDARRKLEGRFRRNADVQGIPSAYYTRNNLTVSGNMSAEGLSFFALGNADTGGNSMNLGTRTDVMGRWAPNCSSDSYPNDFNYTCRGSSLPGFAALGPIKVTTATAPQVALGTRSYDSTTCPKTVRYFSTGTGAPSCAADQKIAFPFNTDSLPNDIEVLRQEAIRQEAADTSTDPVIRDHYVDGLVGSNSKTHEINIWPQNSTYDTVYFYRFPTWSSNNSVTWNVSGLCSDEQWKGVIVVENGNFVLNGNKAGFNGTILAYGGTDPLTGQPYADRGTFTAGGNACMTGYATSTGNMSVTGNYKAGATPALTSLRISAGRVNQVGVRELYE